MKKTALLLLLLILIISSAAGAADLSSVSYLLSADSLEIDALQLEPELRLNSGQKVQFNLAFDGDNFHAGAGGYLNIFSQDGLEIDLSLMVTDEVDGEDFGRAFGISAVTMNPDMNFYWRTFYFINDNLDDKTYYRGGLEYPISENSYFDLSFGNNYWDLSENLINIGIKFDI